ncbi:MAG: NAD(P)-dependent oxidoreductase [Candidatus Paceibacterota bacterium]
MKKFNKIAIINTVKITEESKEKIQLYSKEPIVYPEFDTESEAEICQRIDNADAVLGNFHSIINASILEHSPNLKYIGICGTSLTNIHLEEVRRKNIVIKNVTDYGDDATAEYIFTQLLNLLRGFGQYMWRDGPSELNSKTIGIVGLGATGKKVANIALGFKMKVFYYSKTRKTDWENKGIQYLPINDLLEKSDIITIHVPRDTKVIGTDELDTMGNGKILIDTCLGNIYKDINAVKKWLKNKDNFLIRDHHSEIKKDLGHLEGLIYTEDVIAGMTLESRNLLSVKVIDNIEAYLKTN